MAGSRGIGEDGYEPRPNLWAVLRDVCIAIVQKGQALPMMLLLFLGWVVYRIPQASTLAALRMVLDSWVGAAGWLLWLGTLFLYKKHLAFQRGTMDAEYERIRKENDELLKRLGLPDSPRNPEEK